MGVFTKKYPKITNVLESPVGISYPVKAHVDGFRPTPIKEFVGIYDTGATGCVVTSKVIKELNLPHVGETDTYTPAGKRRAKVYLANIYLPQKVYFRSVPIIEGEITEGVDILIGMNILNTGDFAVTNYNNQTVVSFRIPSVKHIDFNEDKPSPAVSTTIGRNKPCPCGSGKKYKNCCGKVT